MANIVCFCLTEKLGGFVILPFNACHTLVAVTPVFIACISELVLNSFILDRMAGFDTCTAC